VNQFEVYETFFLRITFYMASDQHRPEDHQYQRNQSLENGTD
jgi:hypothetical protein